MSKTDSAFSVAEFRAWITKNAEELHPDDEARLRATATAMEEMAHLHQMLLETMDLEVDDERIFDSIEEAISHHCQKDCDDGGCCGGCK